MPAPANANELLSLVQKSGVVEEPKLRAYIKKLGESSGVPSDPAKLAGLLVRDGILTYFQAEQILQGKYKRFTIGKYKVLEKLGSGGMGQVFLCEHKLMRRRVAVKVLPTAKAEDPSSLERFYREARAVAAVDHPNIVRAYDIDQDENLHFLVMEYVDGTNLQDLIKKGGPIDVVRACHYIYGSAIGLQHAHEMGLVHRDIKPGNILVDRAGVVKVLDMGLARFFHDEDDNLTRNYDENVLGTADYLAPEQALDSHTVDIRADIYSLGATFYYLLTGSSPFPEGSVAQKLIWHQNRQPRPLRSLRADVPEPVHEIIERMMQKDPAKRFQTPAEVIAALAGWVTTPIPPPSDREMPNVSPAAGGGRGLATAGVSTFRSSGSQESPTIVSPVAPVTTPPPLNPFSDMNTPGPAVWESLDSETQTLSMGDTDRTAPSRAPRTPRPTRVPNSKKRKRTLLIAGGTVAILALCFTVYFAFIRKDNKPAPNGGGSGGGTVPRRITVSKAGGENTVPTLRDALTKAGPGDTIAIAEAKLTEPPLRLNSTKHKDLTIESATADGHPAIIEFSGSGILGMMLEAKDVEGVRIKNVTFDGRGTAEVGVQISGTSFGTVLEGITVRGVKTAGFKLSNVAGDERRLVLLDRCRVILTSSLQSGVWVWASNADTRRATIRNMRIEGNGTGIGIQISGAATDLEVSGNRFFNLDAAIAFGQPPSGKVVKVQVTSNTIYQVKVGMTFDLQPALMGEPPIGKYELVVDRNYFASTPEIVKVTGDGNLPGVKTGVNASGSNTGPGNASLGSVSLEKPAVQSSNPAEDDGKFLRFAGGPPEVSPSKAKVVAP